MEWWKMYAPSRNFPVMITSVSSNSNMNIHLQTPPETKNYQSTTSRLAKILVTKTENIHIDSSWHLTMKEFSKKCLERKNESKSLTVVMGSAKNASKKKPTLHVEQQEH